MQFKNINSFLERMEDRIMDYKLSIYQFKEYCDFLQTLYRNNFYVDYIKYLQLLNYAYVLKPNNQEEYFIYQYYKENIRSLVNLLSEKKVSKTK